MKNKIVMLALVSVFSMPILAKDVNFEKKLYSRLERYVKIDTKSDYDSKTFPSTEKQKNLSEVLLEEVKKLGLKNAVMDSYGYVIAELPSNTKKRIPAIGLLAHIDTSPEESGENVIAQMHKNYDGKNLVISKKHNVILSPEESPDLLTHIGEDIVTASGNTLLGADNKAGIAIILTAIEYLIKHPEIKHGPVKVGFFPDEETGRGTEKLDIKKLGVKYVYTVDGGDKSGEITTENFNGDALTIDVKGKSYHPGYGKGVMINATRIACDIVSSWPENILPETTEKKEGYILFDRIKANINEAKVLGIVRSFDIKELQAMERHLASVIETKKHKYPGAEINLTIEKEYRNMKTFMDKNPLATKKLVTAIEKSGLTPYFNASRGGTDGAFIAEKGLPTPDIFTGVGNWHSKYEWVSVDTMNKSTNVVINLVKEWAG